MKKQISFIVLGVMLLLIPGALWAGNQPGVSQDTPAILLSLGQANAIPLDDSAAAAVRGQAQYVLVKVIGLNMFDGWGQNNVNWTWNPLEYRYGNWGGYHYTGNGAPVDSMDFFFQQHDLGFLAQPGISNDKGLLLALNTLPNGNDPYGYNWGTVYVSTQSGYNGGPGTDVPAPSYVNVFGFSLIGGKIFSKPQKMVYSEYSRREAMYGIGLLSLVRK